MRHKHQTNLILDTTDKTMTLIIRTLILKKGNANDNNFSLKKWC